jgi:HEAT repeat protein
MRFLLLGSLLLSGCTPAPTTTVHGKPSSYWLGQLGDPDAAARRRAVKALSGAALADRAVVPALAQALDDPEPAVRKEAVLALLKAGPAAADAAGALQKCLQDGDPDVREVAEKALRRVRGGP